MKEEEREGLGSVSVAEGNRMDRTKRCERERGRGGEGEGGGNGGREAMRAVLIRAEGH